MSDTTPTADELRAKVFAAAMDRGANPSALIESQAAALNALIDSTASALGGDERELAHLEAQLKLGKFSAEAEAFVEAKAWIEALKAVLVEVAAIAIEAGVKAAAGALVASIEGGPGE